MHKLKSKLRKFCSLLLLSAIIFSNVPLLGISEILAAPGATTQMWAMVSGGSYQASPLDVNYDQWVATDFIVYNTGTVNLTGITITCTPPTGFDFSNGYTYTRVHKRNADGSYNMYYAKVPTERLITTGLHINESEVEGFPAGYALTPGLDVQVSYWSKVSLKANTTITNSCSFTTSESVSGSQNYNLNVHYSPSASEVRINEVNTDPLKDWSTNGHNSYFNRGDINTDDEYIELYVNADGLNLADTNWQVSVNNVSSADFSGNLTAGSAFENVTYFGAGSIGNTQTGAYLLLGNPAGANQIDDNVTITVSYLSNEVDRVVMGGTGNTPSGTSTGPLDEVVGRDAASTDTNNDSADFAKKYATPGRGNSDRVANVYEAEIYTVSATGNEHGVEIQDTSANDDRAVNLESGMDINGTVYEAQTNEHQAAGAYRAILRLKTLNATLTSDAPIGEFNVAYPDGGGGFLSTGYAIRGLDVDANNVYQEYAIEFNKPATADMNKYQVGFFDNGTNVVIDNITLYPITPNPTVPITYEGEDMMFKAGDEFNDGGTIVAFSSAAQGSPAGVHMAYGPYTANHTQLLGSVLFNAGFRIRFANSSAGTHDQVARIEVYNSQAGLLKQRDLLGGSISGSYVFYNLQFPSSGQGTVQFRVVNYGRADIYWDYVVVDNAPSQTTLVYESEIDFEHPNGAYYLDYPLASGLKEIYVTPGTHSEGYIQRGPHSLDFVGTGNYYQATFRLRSSSAFTSSDPAAYLLVRNIDTGDILANMEVPINTLRNDYRDYKLMFRSPDSGRLSYEVYYLDNSALPDLYSDKVTVEEIAEPDPKVFQVEAEHRFGNNGAIVEDALASNDIGHTTGLAVQATAVTDNGLVINFTNSQETHSAGGYDAVFYARRSTGATSGTNIALVEVWDETEGFKGYIEIRDTDLSDAGYTGFAVNFTKSGEGRVFYKVYFYGSPTVDFLLDRIELDVI